MRLDMNFIHLAIYFAKNPARKLQLNAFFGPTPLLRDYNHCPLRAMRVRQKQVK